MAEFSGYLFPEGSEERTYKLDIIKTAEVRLHKETEATEVDAE